MSDNPGRDNRVRAWKRATHEIADNADMERFDMLYALVCAGHGVVRGKDEHNIARELCMAWGRLEQRIGSRV